MGFSRQVYFVLGICALIVAMAGLYIGKQKEKAFLEAMIAENRFREDLYHRINVIPVNLPPQPERAEDITALCQYFIRRDY